MVIFKNATSKDLVMQIQRLGILMLCFGIFLGCFMVGIRVLQLKGQEPDFITHGLVVAGLFSAVLGLFILQRKACTELISRL